MVGVDLGDARQSWSAVRHALTWAGALGAAEAAIGKAIELGVSIAVVVLDRGLHPVVVVRMDGVSPLTAAAAEKKARSAASSGASTRDALAYLKADEDLYRAILSTGDVFLVEGGEPLAVAGETVGAVGVSGARHSIDAEIAAAAAATFHARPSASAPPAAPTGGA
ncbi:heme-binding protein [Candidatus Binatia bacterium]|jgi:glc operon protein GlcG|nr:heme-binding protein [Candidatus Binatia bacterium]